MVPSFVCLSLTFSPPGRRCVSFRLGRDIPLLPPHPTTAHPFNHRLCCPVRATHCTRPFVCAPIPRRRRTVSPPISRGPTSSSTPPLSLRRSRSTPSTCATFCFRPAPLVWGAAWHADNSHAYDSTCSCVFPFSVGRNISKVQSLLFSIIFILRHAHPISCHYSLRRSRLSSPRPRRAQADSVVAHDAHQVRGRRFLSSRHSLWRGGRVADQHWLDDGCVIYFTWILCGLGLHVPAV
jgi:hypothetical protein